MIRGARMLGQADEFPEALRTPALFAVPVVVPLVALPYWMWRHSHPDGAFAAFVGVRAPQAIIGNG